ncbi:unnamed protein product [Cladocopium goreaui]|uniref:Uncharacterized protein n=1 Tax=Cladocopium goreaui TaxID=2562237 RepID=A0A9P1D5D6_9DINO|nr:unnamed protein product [Cladocopium goreaui]
MVLRRSPKGPSGLVRLQLYTWLHLRGRARRARAKETEADFGPLLLRRCIAACAGGSEGGYEAVLRNLKTAIAAPESEKSRSGRCHQASRNDMVMRLERALRLDTECRQGQVRVRRLRSSEGLSFL